MITLLIALIFSVVFCINSILAARRHENDIRRQFKHRIHVNGIRGKSSVTRLVAATLREAKIKTVCKTTGTDSRIMVSHKNDWPVERKEANISEQRKLIKRYIGTKYKALVFECMAVNPIYQKYLEEKIMHSTISIITNVREDHVEQLGRTLPEIAKSLCATVPNNGHLITSETDKALLDVIRKECLKKGAIFHSVGRRKITENEMDGFDHFEYKENVLIALEVASILGINRDTALAGMKKAIPDPGSFVIKRFDIDQKNIYWANLFAINDRESFVKTINTINFKIGRNHKRAIILNNRRDRPERVKQFVDIALNEYKTDYIFTFGDYEKKVLREVRQHSSANKPKVICLGNSTEYRDSGGKLLWDKIREHIPVEPVLLVGAVNIHTNQSQNLLLTLSAERALNVS